MTSALAAHYDKLWEDAAPRVAAGGATIDPWLSPGKEDPRRGITLLARPTASCVESLCAFMEDLRALEPGQRYQPAADLHYTVLSLFTATADYAGYVERLPDYLDAVSKAAHASPPFTIDVRGVTLTPDAVLAQGFPRGDELSMLRDNLRAELGKRGLGDGLDRRYRLVTAHMTLVRFAAPMRDPRRFVAAVAGARQTAFGRTHVERLELVLGDWFHSARNKELLAQLELRRAP